MMARRFISGERRGRRRRRANPARAAAIQTSKAKGSGGGKAAGGVQHPGKQRGQGNEQDIREGDPPVIHGQVEAFIACKARCHGQHEGGHEEVRQNRQHDQDGGQQCQRAFCEILGVFLALQLFREKRDKGHVERAFGKEAAEHVGQGKGNDEGFCRWARAQVGGKKDIADKAQYPAGQGPDADGEKAPDQPDGFHERALS